MTAVFTCGDNNDNDNNLDHNDDDDQSDEDTAADYLVFSFIY